MGLQKMLCKGSFKMKTFAIYKLYLAVCLCREQWPRSIRRVVIFCHPNIGIVGSNRARYLTVLISMLPCEETISGPAVEGVLTNINKEKHGKNVDCVGRVRPIIL